MPFTGLGTTYNTAMNADDVPCVVKVGGDTEKFVPNLNLSKWDDTCWLNINHADIVGTEKESLTNDVLELAIGDKIHRYYTKGTEEVEYEIEFASQPHSNIIELDLDFPDGLIFYYQDTMENDYAAEPMGHETFEAYAANHNKPEKIEQSYAVYWSRKNRQFKTGKFCHIYRPVLIDAEDTRRWATIEIVGKTLQITCDFKDLVFPVIVDPTIGLTSIGGSSGGLTDILIAFPYNAATTGTANPGAFYIYAEEAVDTRGRGCVYSESSSLPSALLSSNEAQINITALTWYNGAITYTDFSVGVNYWIGVHSSGLEIYYDTVSDSEYIALDFDSGLPDPFGSPASLQREHSCYVDYTITSGGTIELDGAIVSDSDIASRLDRIRELIAKLDNVSNVVGSMERLKDMGSGALVNTSNLIAVLISEVIIELTAEIISTSNITGELGRVRLLTADIINTTNFTGTLTKFAEFSALINTTSTMSGAIVRFRELIASIPTTTDLTGTLVKIAQLTAIINSISNIIGALSIEEKLTATTQKIYGFIERQDRIYGKIQVDDNYFGSIEVDDLIFGGIK